MYKISVIVPVYNTEPYLRKCLDGIVNQTHRNLEIIIVDDGSPDNSGAICDEYANRDNRIKVIHKKNGGLSAAWNDGIAMATGDFIAFVDSDDWVDTFLFEKLLQAPQADKADVIVASQYYEERTNSVHIRKSFSEPFLFLDGKGETYLRVRVLSTNDGTQQYDKLVFVWNKLYRTAFIRENNFSFDEKVRAGLGNDGLFNFRVFGEAQTVCGVICAGYHYRYMDTSGTRRFDPNRPEAVHYLLNCFCQYIDLEKTSLEVWNAFQVQELVYLRGNFFYCYFHPENKESSRIVAEKIREMKKMPHYRDAIYAKNNQYLTMRQIILKYALRLPFVWPLKLLCSAKRKLVIK